MTENTALIPESGIADERMTETEKSVLKIVRDVLGKSDLGPEDDMFDHGATSLSFVRVLAQIKKELLVMVRAAELDGHVTVRALAANAEAHRGA